MIPPSVFQMLFSNFRFARSIIDVLSVRPLLSWLNLWLLTHLQRHLQVESCGDEMFILHFHRWHLFKLQAYESDARQCRHSRIARWLAVINTLRFQPPLFIGPCVYYEVLSFDERYDLDSVPFECVYIWGACLTHFTVAVSTPLSCFCCSDYKILFICHSVWLPSDSYVALSQLGFLVMACNGACFHSYYNACCLNATSRGVVVMRITDNYNY